jgi:hypothetical protein
MGSPQRVEPGSENKRADNGKSRDPEPVQKEQRNEVPKRGALRIARLKHAGDWYRAPRATANGMELLPKPPNKFNVDIQERSLPARDPNIIYCPLLYLHGRNAFSLEKADLEALRNHLDPGGGTLFADADRGSAAFDTFFRRLVRELYPDRALEPIPVEDELYSASVGADLSSVEYNKAAGGRRGFPKLDGVRINGHWAIIYSKYDIGGALDAQANIEGRGYTLESAGKIFCNIVIYSTLP